MTRRSPALLAALALALNLTACGEPRDSERARTAVVDFLTALENADGAAACDHLSEAGVSELLLTALHAGASREPPAAPSATTCQEIAERLATESDASQLAALARARTIGVTFDGDRATVHTTAGAYETGENGERWLLDDLGPAAHVLRGDAPPADPVALTIVEPHLDEPALGDARAGSTTRATVKLEGTVQPETARVSVRALTRGTRVTEVETADGRFTADVELREGPNELRLTARAPGRETTERAVRITRR